MKRCFVTGALIVALLGFSLLLFMRFFDINAHRDFISRQIEQLSGYQVNFESIDSHLWFESTVSLSGLSLTLDNHQVLYIDQVKVSLTKLNLWDRELALGPVQLTGMRIKGDFTALIKAADANTEENSATVQQTTAIQSEQKLAWRQLTVSRLSVNDLNIGLTHAGQRVVVEGADFRSDNLLIIDDWQLVKSPSSGNLKLLVRELSARRSVGEILRVKNLQLSGSFNLKNLQANLNLKAGSLNLALAGQEEIAVQDTELVASLDNNKARITKLNSTIFSGELQLQADALFSIKPLSSPFLSLEQLTVQRLAIKDMNIVIPTMANETGVADKNKLTFPINNLTLKALIVENVNIRSNNSKIPLAIKNLNSSVSDFVLLQNKQLAGLVEEHKEAGSFVLRFEYLRWMESTIEQFEISGKLSKNDLGILLIKQLLAG
ncbi:MAG: hypothetical protein ACJAZP_002464 [Psychromonas sp.]|jgi:hypothetical protein|uniref:hypothetical protein n=1 Tax=Psychromonas sp. TaxID=1884585 RepID=UPI0039E55B57